MREKGFDSYGDIDREEVSRNKLITSIVIPFYESEDTIVRAVSSALTQDTKFQYNVIVVDDGNITPVKDILGDLNSDERVFIRRQENRGVGGAMNLGCLSAADYIIRLDADDELLPQAVQSLTEKLKGDDGLSYVYSDGWWMGELKGWGWEYHSLPNKDRLVNPWNKLEFCSDLLLESMYLGHARGFKRKSFLEVGGYNSDYKIGEDWDFALKMSEVGGIKRVPEKLHKYYLLDSGATMSLGKSAGRDKDLRNIVKNAIFRRGMKFGEIPRKVRDKFKLTLENIGALEY